MTNRREEFEIKIEASPEDVWRMLTTAEGLSTWFGTEASIEFEIGGSRTVGWAGTSSFTGEIAEIDELTKLVVKYSGSGEGGAAEEWLMHSDGTTTVLRLIHSMPDDDIEDWEGFYGDIRRGWTLFMASMKHALEEAETPTREVDAVHPETSDRVETWNRIKAIIDSSADLLDGMRPTLEIPPHTMYLTSADRTLIVDQEGAGEHHVIFIQASTFGGPAEWREKIIERLIPAGQR